MKPAEICGILGTMKEGGEDVKKQKTKKKSHGLLAFVVDSVYDDLKGQPDRSTGTLAGIGALALMGYAVVAMFKGAKDIEKHGY